MTSKAAILEEVRQLRLELKGAIEHLLRGVRGSSTLKQDVVQADLVRQGWLVIEGELKEARARLEYQAGWIEDVRALYPRGLSELEMQQELDRLEEGRTNG